MTLSLQNLKRPRHSVRSRKRVGRGNASGHGTYSTRGQKGQKARSGTGGLKRLGLRPMLLATPKFKGQRPRRPKMAIVNVETLEKKFEAGAVIDEKTLLEKKIISDSRNGVKILGRGGLAKKFTVIANAFSKGAKDAIIKAGGKIIVRG